MQCLTFLSEFGSCVVCVSVCVEFRLSWAAAPPDEDLRTQTETLREKYLFENLVNIILQCDMTLLTTGSSLLSLLPSEVLLSEVGEYSLFWAEVRNQNEVKKLSFLFTLHLSSLD